VVSHNSFASESLADLPLSLVPDGSLTPSGVHVWSKLKLIPGFAGRGALCDVVPLRPRLVARGIGSKQMSALKVDPAAVKSFHYIIIHQLLQNTKTTIHQPTDAMDKLKSMFGKDKHHEGASSSSPTTQSTARSGGNPDNAEGVILHTNLGDITIALFKDQTPKVSLDVESTSRMPTLTCLDLQELCHSGSHRQIRQRHLPPHHPGLHDPGL